MFIKLANAQRESNIISDKECVRHSQRTALNSGGRQCILLTTQGQADGLQLRSLLQARGIMCRRSYTCQTFKPASEDQPALLAILIINFPGTVNHSAHTNAYNNPELDHVHPASRQRACDNRRPRHCRCDAAVTWLQPAVGTLLRGKCASKPSTGALPPAQGAAVVVAHVVAIAVGARPLGPSARHLQAFSLCHCNGCQKFHQAFRGRPLQLTPDHGPRVRL